MAWDQVIWGTTASWLHLPTPPDPAEVICCGSHQISSIWWDPDRLLCCGPCPLEHYSHQGEISPSLLAFWKALKTCFFSSTLRNPWGTCQMACRKASYYCSSAILGFMYFLIYVLDYYVVLSVAIFICHPLYVTFSWDEQLYKYNK